MTEVISVTVAFSAVVYKISNLPLLIGQPMHLVFFDFIHCVTIKKQNTIILRAKAGSTSSTTIWECLLHISNIAYRNPKYCPKVILTLLLIEQPNFMRQIFSFNGQADLLHLSILNTINPMVGFI